MLLVVVFTGLIALQTAMLWWRHEEMAQQAKTRSDALARILGEHVAQTVIHVDQALTQLFEQNELLGGPYVQPMIWPELLYAAHSGLPGVEALSILDATGKITHSTLPDTVGRNFGERSLFASLIESPAFTLIPIKHVPSKIGEHRVIPLGRKLYNSSGRVAGFAVATLDPYRLLNFYRTVELGDAATVSMFHGDGTLLLRNPPNESSSSGQSSSLAAALQKTSDRFVRGTLEPRGDSYFTSYRRLNEPPLLLAISLNEHALFTEWSRELRISILISAAIAILLLMAGWLLLRELRARASAEAARERDRAQFHTIMYDAPLLVTVKDTQRRLTFINREMEQLLGISLEEARGKRLEEIDPGEGSDLMGELDQEAIDTKAPLQREVSYMLPSGVRTALVVKFPLLDQNGEIEALASFSTDVTERWRAESWFKTIMDNAPLLIVVKDVKGRFIFANKALQESLGMKAEEILGKSSNGLFPENKDYADAHDAFDQEVIAARKPIQREFLAPYPGGERWLLFVKFPIFDARGNVEGIGSITTDITAQKQTEAQLAHAHRMEAVGQLTGGIAHDFNNLLTVIIGNAELLTDALAMDERLHPLARVALDAAERSAALTQRLLAFGRRQVLEPQPTSANRLLQDMEDLIERAAGNNVQIVYQCDENLWSSIVDPGQLETAILNLVVNSRDAMPDTGTITIETANVELDEDYAHLNPDARPGEYVMIAVSDTGTGMTPDVVARVFEPFFTTKEIGKGTGLGLPTIYGFIKQSDGHVKIESAVGQGTTVRLYIPRSDAPTLAPSLPSADTEQLPRGNETILLAEDDKLVRAHTERQLMSLGYRVVSAPDADSALKLARVVGKPDLLLTDMIMPGGKKGNDLAARLRKRWPDLKVLFTSGYTDGAMLEPLAAANGELNFLAKPFRRLDLALKVRETLDSPAAAEKV